MHKITISGPGFAGSVVEAVELTASVADWRWSALVDMRPDWFRDPARARQRLDAIAAKDRELWESKLARPELRVRAVDDDTAVVDATPSQMAGVADLWMRVHLGQFDRLGVGAGWLEDLGRLRVEECVVGTFPDHPHASWGIHSSHVDAQVRRMYNVWRLLGGGADGRDTITGHPVSVIVEEPVDG